ncbi:MAG TPA: ABC transporter ATP-binding protein [Vitreimonas sp.]|nr:ABC transporter ATP-binding protein [Vitreimonas sp.]
MTGPAAVRARGVVKRYAGRAVLDGVDLEVPRGELFALLGPNGAGKTTLVEILEGYRTADGGSIDVLGEVAPARAGAAWRARVGLMLQGGGVDPRVTPREALSLFARFHVAPRGVEELLDLVGLRAVAGTRYRRLSGGERQRLALALALIGRPELLFLDEPTAGMDPQARAQTRELLAGLCRDGTTIVLTTHDLADVERVASRVAILHAGRIVATGTPSEVAGDGAAGLEIRFARAIDPLALHRALAPRWPLSAVGVDAYDPLAVLVQGVSPDPSLIAAVAGWAAGEAVQITDLRTGGGGLEARYLELTGASEAAR